MTDLLAARIDGVAASLPIDDRGLAYGDGVFETLLCVGGHPIWWSEHLARLYLGAERLGITAPTERAWLADVATMQSKMPARAALRLTLTRGCGRGYAPASGPPRRIVSLFPAPPPWASPLALHWCRLRLSMQPALAGIKHLNRLEQVLAARECVEAHADEGLLCASDGRVISAVSSNLFALVNGRWLTPRIRDCGILGICRSVLLPILDAVEEDVAREAIDGAETLILCNSVRGVGVVGSAGDRHFGDSEAVVAMLRALVKAAPVFRSFLLSEPR